MNELRKTKEEFFVVLQAMIRMYQALVANSFTAEKAMEMTLESYDDFYEWLQGELDE
jgi:hypothetical protein